MRNSLFSTFVTAAVFALAGCAAEPGDPSTENTDSTQAANVAMDDRAHLVLNGTYDTQGVGGRGGVAIADDKQTRMYDFSATPRIGQRAQYEANLTLLNNASAIPLGLADGPEVRRSADEQASINGPQ